jgi:porphobilinogen synthase
MAKHDLNINLRRLRLTKSIRELTATVQLNHRNFIQPLFVEEKLKLPKAIKGLEGINVDTIATIISTIEKDIQSGVTKFLLFPIPSQKYLQKFNFSFASNVVLKIKKHFKDKIWLACDVCLCSYTTHGHCGLLNKDQTKILNSASVKVLAEYALQLCIAGVDCIAPSDMMDGRIGHIRETLNNKDFDHVTIMSYSSKFSSQFYGPFRDACNSTPNGTSLQNRKSYQIAPYHKQDAINSALRDESEGADILMVKPAALYTDIILSIRAKTQRPIAAYHVSGEYAAIECLAKENLVNRELAHIEVWMALVRSGATIIISYASRHAKEWISKIDF